MTDVTGRRAAYAADIEAAASLDAAARAAPRGRTLYGDARRRFLSNPAAAAALALLTVLVLFAFFGAGLSSWDFETVDWGAFRAPPSLESGHYFGTDSNARDLFARTLIGAQMSLTVAAVATTVSVVIGVIYGATAGYMGGRIDAWMMRFVDIMYAFPQILFIILLMVMFGRNPLFLFIGIGCIEWLTMARIVRGQTLSLKEKEFIEAARASGQRSFTIIRRHIIPNLLGPVAIYAALTVPEIILVESFLSFLGMGVQEPMTSLGTLISEGAAAMESLPWLLFFPAGTLVALLLCLAFVGDGLRDALDPKER